MEALPRAEGLSLPLALDAIYLKVRWGASIALLVCVGVNEKGFREFLAVEDPGW